MIVSRERVFFGMAAAYTLMLVACTLALTLVPYVASEPAQHAMRGCHLTGDQLVFGATCHGFFGDDAVAVLLSLPLALVLLPLSALGTLFEAAEAGHVGRLVLGAVGVFMGASLWAPLVHFVGTVRRLVRWEEPPPALGAHGAAAEGSAASSAVRPSSR
jgi:hypothetical protein